MLVVYHKYKENVSDPVFKVNLYSNLHLSFKPHLAFFMIHSSKLSLFILYWTLVQSLMANLTSSSIALWGEETFQNAYHFCSTPLITFQNKAHDSPAGVQQKA